MPREKIHCVTEPFDVQVGWQRAMTGYLQVGVTTNDGRSINWILYRDHAEQLGTQVVELLERLTTEASTPQGIGEAILNLLDGLGEMQSELPHYTGLWADLDRAGANSLIRTLRRARDSAFGKDE